MEDLSLLGARLVRIAPNTKKPIEQWKENARYYSKEECESAFIGLNVAVVADNTLVIIDIEGPKKTGCANGWTTILGLQKAQGTLPMTVQYTTPSGGAGMIFRAPHYKVPFVDLSKDYGLEMRTGMHFNLLPPSFYNGEEDGKSYSGAYNWIHTPEEVIDSEREIPEIPFWLVQWFKENACKNFDDEGKQKISSPQNENKDFLLIVEENLPHLNPDMSYPDWWRVMAICHRGCPEKGYALFVNWSRRGEKWKEGITNEFVDEQWQKLDERLSKRQDNGENILGLRALLDMVVAEVKPQIIHIPLESPKQKFEELWPLLPLFGCLEKFRCEIQESMPWQNAAAYAVPMVCLQAALQRRIVYAPEGLQSHWWAFIGPPASNKSEMKRIIQNVMQIVNPKVCVDSFESGNGIKAMLCEYPSRLLIMDEGIKSLNAMNSAGSKSSFDTKNAGVLLALYNNKTDQTQTTNRVAAHRIPKVVLPQLFLCTFDQQSYWNEFKNSSAIDNGMLSRFLVVSLNQMPNDWDEKNTKRLSHKSIETFAREISDLVPKDIFRFSFNQKNEEEFHSWSPIDLAKDSDFSFSRDAREIVKQFNNSLIEWANADGDMRIPIFHRAVEAVVLFSQMLAKADGQFKVSPQHVRSACGVVFQTVTNIGKGEDENDVMIVREAHAILREEGPQSITALIKKIPKKYWRKKGEFKNAVALLRNTFGIKNNKVSLN
jgi:mRNA-degrading endonuclease HigB of HigAB toxin-antitoxin module